MEPCRPATAELPLPASLLGFVSLRPAGTDSVTRPLPEPATDSVMISASQGRMHWRTAFRQPSAVCPRADIPSSQLGHGQAKGCEPRQRGSLLGVVLTRPVQRRWVGIP